MRQSEGDTQAFPQGGNETRQYIWGSHPYRPMIFLGRASLHSTQKDGVRIKTLRSDRGGEYLSADFDAHLSRTGWRSDSTAP